MQMMFFGVVFIAAFGAAGMLSAIAASDPGDQFEGAARNYLIGTSVSYHGHQNLIASDSFPSSSESSQTSRPFIFCAYLIRPKKMLQCHDNDIVGLDNY